jgi:hypothetical protein
VTGARESTAARRWRRRASGESGQQVDLMGSDTIAVHCRNASAPQFLDVGLIVFR